MMNHICRAYKAIDEIYLIENLVKMMGLYNPVENVARLIEQLLKGQDFARPKGEPIADAMMVSKDITLLSETTIFNDDIQKRRWQPADLNTWPELKGFSPFSPKLFGKLPPSPPEEHNAAIGSLHAITQVINYQRYEMNGLLQEKSVPISTNTAVMAQLVQLTADIGKIQAQIQKLAYITTKTKSRY